MSRGKAWLASSLALCSTAMMSTDSHPVYAAQLFQPSKPKWDKEQLAQEVLYQYLNPITVVADGNLDATVETTPLTYTVKKGDTLTAVSGFYGVPLNDLITNNRVDNPDLLRVGQTLSIPLTRKWIRLDTDDTLESIAQKYTTSVELLTYLNPKLKEAGVTYVGQQIAVPQKVATASLTEQPKPQTTRETKRRIYIRQPGELGRFEWPISGRITSSFGWRDGRQHKGIDIWNPAASSCVIHSAQGGTVVRAGYSGAYGNLVVIAHPGGWETYYAHMSRITVSRGQVVDTGQMVGYMGRTGDATGYHLHFEVHRNGQVLNPLVLLGR